LNHFILNPKYWLWPVVAWAAVLLLSLLWSWHVAERQVHEMATGAGRSVFKTVEAMRLWNAGHGGVYAPVGGGAKPNSYLDAPERDIVTRSGKKLTLLNPSHMTRQLAEIVNEQEGGMVLHLTSLKPLNPANAANEWESAALQSFAQGETEHSAFVEEGGHTYSRYLAPLRVVQACIPCHKKQGYKLGDISGGLSVVFPADPFLVPLQAEKRNLEIAHFALWLLLSGVSLFLLMRLRQQMFLLQEAGEQQEKRLGLRTAELQEQAQERAQAEAKMRQIVNSFEGGVYGVDPAGNCTFCNPAALRLLGYQDISEVLGRNMHGLVHAACQDMNRQPSGVCRLNTYRDGMTAHVEDDVFWRADGSAMPTEYRSHPIFFDGNVIGAVVTFAGIAERLEMQKDMWNKANFDELTGLPNRNLFYDRLEQAIVHSARIGSQVALLYIDLDGFKAVNDRLGYAAGDELLRLAAERLEGCVRESDTVARLGGDKFTIVLPQVSREFEVEVVAGKALEHLSQAFRVGGNEACVSASIGIALYPRDGSNGIVLIKHANVAMCQAKESGRDAYRFFSSVESHGQ